MIRFRTEDCIDLPPQRFIIRDVEMTQEQSEAYEQMETMLFLELDGQPVTAKVAASKMIKLREITGGFIITDARENKPFNKDAAKMLEIDTLLAQSIADKLGDEGPPSKAVIWANYEWETHTLLKRYASPYGARGLFGGISSNAKDRAIEAFYKDPKCRLLVCHPASVGHGLNLTPANFIFYYSLSHDYEEFYQSYRRTRRPGQKRPQTYYFLVCPETIDEELIDAIRAKKNLSDIVTDGRFSSDEILQRRRQRSDQQIQIEWGADDVPPAAP
jgi:SNF2 family DNA or RNA helicase